MLRGWRDRAGRVRLADVLSWAGDLILAAICDDSADQLLHLDNPGARAKAPPHPQPCGTA